MSWGSNHNTTQGTRPVVELDHGQTRHRHAVFTLWVNFPTFPRPILVNLSPLPRILPNVTSCGWVSWQVLLWWLKTCMLCFSRNQRFVKLMKILMMNFEVDKIYRLDMVSLCWLWSDKITDIHDTRFLKPCSRHLIRHAVFLRRFWLSVRWAIPMHNVPFCQEKRKQAHTLEQCMGSNTKHLLNCSHIQCRWAYQQKFQHLVFMKV